MKKVYYYKHFLKMLENKKTNNIFNKVINYIIDKKIFSIDNIKSICKRAVENNFYSISVYPELVNTIKTFLDNEDVKICTIIPPNINKMKDKIDKILNAISNNTDEIDVSLNIKDLKELSSLSINKDEKIENEEKYKNMYDELVDSIRQMSFLCHKNGVLLKLSIDVNKLNFHDIKLLCDICIDSAVDCIKISQGISKSNKSFNEILEIVKFIRKIIPYYINIEVVVDVKNNDENEILLQYVNRLGLYAHA